MILTAAMNATPPPDSRGPDYSPEPESVGAGIDFSDPNSPLAPYYLQTSQVIGIALIAGVFVLLGFVPLMHTDIWGHLKFGQWIVTHERLPDGDPLCPFAEHDSGVTYPGQLGQAFTYLIFHTGESLAGGDHLQRLAGGVELIRFSHALMVALRLTLLWIAFRRVSGSWPLACAALTLLIVLSIGNIAVVRPQVAGELCFAVVLLALSRPVLSLRAVVLLPILTVIWANAHGSFGSGLLLLGCCALGRVIEAGWADGFAGILKDAQVRRLVGVTLASTIAIACLNPSGPSLYRESLALAAHPVVNLQDEWQPLRFHLGGGGQWSYLVIGCLLAVTQSRCTRWFSITTLLLIVVFGVQPLRHQRMLIWWLMVAPWLMARYWPDCTPQWTLPAATPSFRKTLIAVAFLFLAGVLSIPGQWLISGQPGKLERTLSAGTPWRLVEVLRDSSQTPDPNLSALAKSLREHYPQQHYIGCIFATETLGDYLLWDLPPEVPVFIYTHVNNFGLAHWDKTMAIRSGASNWRHLLDEYRVNLVVVEPDRNPQLCALLRQDRDWQIVVDETGLAAKPDPRNRHFVALRVRPKS